MALSLGTQGSWAWELAGGFDCACRLSGGSGLCSLGVEQGGAISVDFGLSLCWGVGALRFLGP